MLYRLACPGIKIHVMTDEQVMLDVMENLTDRFETSNLKLDRDASRNHFIWDPGGKLRFDPNEKMFSFFISGEMVVRVRSQHWFSFLKHVRNSLIDTTRAEEVYGGKFFKIHGELYVACFSKQQRDDLLKQISEKSEEYDQVAWDAWGHIKSFGEEHQPQEYLLG